ncbi:hypothetical protein NE237_010028 [Protea cynaroides]|uniref:SHSP domain-containing protein n=1 Tax=Protea cynaroides TaxID=273540 RepID=A0A9Q0KYT3_9MAGN|nr:hypothetical protein NE237_010028 [Protea cynaroides]
MEGKTKASSTLKRSYEDFQPSLHWEREEGRDTLVIPLTGFKKDQLKIKINYLGNMKITGERPLEENKWSRFHMDFRIPKDCNVNEIHGKFAGEILYVRMPKKLTPLSIQHEQTSCEFRVCGFVLKLNQSVRVVLSVSLAIAVLVTVGIYVAHRLRSTND